MANGAISLAAVTLTALGHPWIGAAIVSAGNVLVETLPWIGARKAALSQRRTALQKEVSRRSQAVVSEMLDHWSSTVDGPLRDSISSHLGQWRLANRKVRDLGDHFAALADTFDAATTELDVVLVRALLELEGHRDLAESVMTVVRVPGAECAVTLDLPPLEAAMRMHPHLRGAAFLPAAPEPPLAVLTRVLGRRATHGWRAVASGGSPNEHLLQVIAPSTQLADEARRVAAFATQVLQLPGEVRTPMHRSYDNRTGVAP